MIRMIVTDLDGTLLSSRSEIPEENIRALRRAMDAGAMVTLASGRMLEATLPIARAIGINAPLSLFNGAMAYDMARTACCAGTRSPSRRRARRSKEIGGARRLRARLSRPGLFSERALPLDGLL